MASDFAPLYRQFKILPHDEELYQMAFTHKSYNGMAGTRHFDYERLEFLGDSLVGLVVSELCYLYHPDMEQGELSVLKAQFIRTASEAGYARKFGLDRYIKVGASVKTPIDKSPSLLEDVFESFLGAVYIDQGFEFAYKLTRSLFEQDVKNGSIHTEQNPKSALQEAMQAEKRESVCYKVLHVESNPPNQTFTVGVYFEDQLLGEGEGRSKKSAETAAAAAALQKLAKKAEGD